MKKLIAGAILASTATIANSADLSKVYMVAHCGNSEDIIKEQFYTYAEQPMLTGDGVITDPENPNFPGTTVIWKHPTEDKFSITFTPKNNEAVTCYVITGANMEIYTGSGT